MQSNGTVVYLSGRITGDPDYKRKFYARAAELQLLGYVVLNPAALPPGLEYERYMAIDFAMIDACDVVDMLPGWMQSPGSRREHAYAVHCGKTIWMVEDAHELL